MLKLIKICPVQIKSIILQIMFLALSVYGVYHLIENVNLNLTRYNISSGFNFLSEPAGFGIISTPIEYSESSTYFRAFLVGLLNTLIVSIMSVFFCTIIGFLIGISRLSQNWLVARLAAAYVEILRNIPLLLQIFFWYFGVLRNLPSVRNSISVFDTFFLNNRGLFVPKPYFEGGQLAFMFFIPIFIFLSLHFLFTHQKYRAMKLISGGVLAGLVLIIYSSLFIDWEVPVFQGFNFKGGIDIIPELVALVVALSLYTAAFVAEIVRSGLMSVSTGQSEAARTLGLKPWQIQRYIIIPQAMKLMTPQLSIQYLNVFKNSSLGTAIAYPDLMNVFAGTVLNQTGQAIEVVLMTIVVYLTASLIISFFMGWYNRRLR